jgi:hypothetical protein
MVIPTKDMEIMITKINTQSKLLKFRETTYLEDNMDIITTKKALANSKIISNKAKTVIDKSKSIIIKQTNPPQCTNRHRFIASSQINLIWPFTSKIIKKSTNKTRLKNSFQMILEIPTEQEAVQTGKKIDLVLNLMPLKAAAL